MGPVPRSGSALSHVKNKRNQRHVCLSCQRLLSKRPYATAAAAQAEANETSSPSPSPEPTSTTSLSPRPMYQIHTGVVLSRPPQITRDLHSFESAFYFYQKRLNERLALPFMRYFYYKKGSPEEIVWKRQMKERLTPARDIGRYHAYGKEAWNDELLVGDKLSEQRTQMEVLLQDIEDFSAASNAEDQNAPGAEQSTNKEPQIEKPAERVTEADRTGDVTSLNRLLQRTLFLLVKDEKGRWAFPVSRLLHGETLNEGAERCLSEAAGRNMNTWVVGRVPIGHYVNHFPTPSYKEDKDQAELGQKEFFLKGRIMAGQANLKDNRLGLTEFRWLAKEEIQKLVTPRYWSMTEAMLEDR